MTRAPTVAEEDASDPSGAAEPDARNDARRRLAESVRVVRVGHGGNCSSVGSVIDTLFLAAAAGGAILAAICAAMRDEDVTIVGSRSRASAPGASTSTNAPDAEDP